MPVIVSVPTCPALTGHLYLRGHLLSSALPVCDAAVHGLMAVRPKATTRLLVRTCLQLAEAKLEAGAALGEVTELGHTAFSLLQQSQVSGVRSHLLWIYTFSVDGGFKGNIRNGTGRRQSHGIPDTRSRRGGAYSINDQVVDLNDVFKNIYDVPPLLGYSCVQRGSSHINQIKPRLILCARQRQSAAAFCGPSLAVCIPFNPFQHMQCPADQPNLVLT